MIIDETHLLKLIKGIQNFQKTSSIAASEKDAYKPRPGSISPFLSDILAQSFVGEQKILNEIFRDKALSGKVLKSNKYSPLSFTLDLTVSKNRPHFFEFFHLCEKYHCFLHPSAIPFLLKQPLPYRIKAEILSRIDSQTMDLIVGHSEFNPYWVDIPVTDLDENQPVKLWWYFQARNISPEILGSEIWELLSPGQKKEILQSSGPEEILNFLEGIPIQFTTNSRKYNTMLLACALTNLNFNLSSDVIEFLRAYVKEPDHNILPASLENLKGSYPFSVSHWISFLLAATQPDRWLDNQSIAELKKWDFSSLSEETYRSLLESSVKFSHETLFLLIAQRSPGPKIANGLEEIYRQNPAFRITSSFFHKVSRPLLYEIQRPHTLAIIDTLWKFYEGFVANAISEAILQKLKDAECKLLQSEKGIKTGGQLCEKLAYSANPLLLKSLQLMPGNFVFHPLEDSFEKILTCWRYRLEMRKAFIN